MKQVRNIRRFWVDNKTDIIIREWTNQEYEEHNSTERIFEKYWRAYCQRCKFTSIPSINKEEAKHDCKVHKHYYKGHPVVAKYIDCELFCLEIGEKLDERSGMWTSYMNRY